MTRIIRGNATFAGPGAAVIVLVVIWSLAAHGQSKVPTNPPYRIIADWPQVPANLKLGAVPGIHIGPDGNIYAFHRCGADSCVGSNEPTILKFDRSGRLLKSWGAGMFNFPHASSSKSSRIDRNHRVAPLIAETHTPQTLLHVKVTCR